MNIILITILAGITLNLILIGLYFSFHRMIKKYEVVHEQILKVAKRARASYILPYLFCLIIIASVFYIPGIEYKLGLVFIAIALLIIIEISHDNKRLLLTENQITYIEGLFSYTAMMIEYKDIEIITLKDTPLDKFLGYGDFKIRTIGGEEYTFNKIPKFIEIKNLIEQKKISKN